MVARGLGGAGEGGGCGQRGVMLVEEDEPSVTR